MLISVASMILCLIFSILLLFSVMAILSNFVFQFTSLGWLNRFFKTLLFISYHVSFKLAHFLLESYIKVRLIGLDVSIV
jgi:hypothetical protein